MSSGRQATIVDNYVCTWKGLESPPLQNVGSPFRIFIPILTFPDQIDISKD